MRGEEKKKFLPATVTHHLEAANSRAFVPWILHIYPSYYPERAVLEPLIDTGVKTLFVVLDLSLYRMALIGMGLDGDKEGTRA